MLCVLRELCRLWELCGELKDAFGTCFGIPGVVDGEEHVPVGLSPSALQMERYMFFESCVS